MTTIRRSSNSTTAVRVVLGGLVGLAVSAPVYLLLVDWLEGRSGLLREMQGWAWNLMLLGVVAGALIGALVHRRLR